MAAMAIDRGPRRSLRATMAILIVSCWVLPILVLVGVSGYVTTRSTYARVSDIVTVSIESAADAMRKELDGVVSDAMNASYIPTLRTAYTQFERDGNEGELYTAARPFLSQYYARSPRLRAAYLLMPEVSAAQRASFFAYNPASGSYNDAVAFFEGGAAARAEELMATLDTGIEFIYEGGRLYMVRLLSLRSNRLDPYAALVLEINVEALCESLFSLPWITGAALQLGGAEMSVVGDGEAVFREGHNAAVHAAAGQGGLLVCGESGGERFTLAYCVLADLQPLLQQTGNPLWLVLALVLLTIPLLALVFVFFYRKVTRPISTLSQLSRDIEEGGFGRQVEAEKLGSREFYTLGKNLNAMSARLEFQFERLYREELALRDARIKALQSQINPHFLGNTLEIINWEARLAGNVKVSRMMEALSTMMEAALDRRHRPLVHLSEEMMYVNSYLYIIGERLGKRLEVVQEIDESLLDWYVPRLILQPIVENAIDHGVSTRQRGRITIRAIKRQDGWMSLEVENDTPMSREDEARARRLLETDEPEEGESSGNIGIRNVHQRLRILYGPQGGLSVTNTKNGSTLSAMCIQYRQEQQIESI